MIIGMVGNVRTGKTLSAVRELYKLYLKGYHIYSNIKLKFPFIPLTREYLYDVIEKDIELPDLSVFFIDEIHIWIDSRSSSSKNNRVISYFLLQTGKQGANTDYGMILFYTTQYIHQIDKRLRSTTDLLASCSKFSYHGYKIFCVNYMRVFDGMSFMDSFIGTKSLYSLYNTRERIKIEVSRYEED